MCDSVKAAAAATEKLCSEWLEKEISKFKKILKLYGSCHSIFNASKELSPQEISSFSKLSKGKTLKIKNDIVSFILVNEMMRIKFKAPITLTLKF